MNSQANGNPSAVEPAEVGPSAAERAESVLVAFAIGQGVVLGLWLTLFPASVLRAGGFPPAAAFFVRWAGVLHAILATGYALDWLRFRRTSLLVVGKGATALFLSVAWIADGLPWLMVFAVILEASIAIASVLLRIPAERSRRARARLRLITPAPGIARPASHP